MSSMETWVRAIAFGMALLATLFILSLKVMDPKILLAIAVLSALYAALSISSLISVSKHCRAKEELSEIKIVTAIAILSALLAAFLGSIVILTYTQPPSIPEKGPVFKIEDESVREDLVRRGLMGEGYLNVSGVEELIERGVYRIDPEGRLELVRNETSSAHNGEQGG